MDLSPRPPDITGYLAESSAAERQLLRLFDPEAALVICDIGSCEGEDTVRYARRFPRARIFAFEPLPGNLALIRANFDRYGIRQAELVPLALSDRVGEASLHVSSGRPPDEFAGRDWNYGNKSSSLLPPESADPMYGWIEFKETVTVPTETLDRFCAARGLARIDFIHMDVQGAEALVLAGATRMLPHTTALCLEVTEKALYRGQPLRTEIETLLRDRGFALGFETRREIEGDQFYVNRRQPRTWRYLAARRTGALISRLRRLAAGLKRGPRDGSAPSL